MNIDQASIPNGKENDEFYQQTIYFGDIFNAKCFVDNFGDQIRYCHEWSSWMIWDKSLGIWQRDDENHIHNLFVASLEKSRDKSVYLDTYRRMDFEKNYKSTKASLSKIRAAIAAASFDRKVVVSSNHFDANPYLFTVANGTIDLRTRELRPHNSLDLITKRCPTEWNSTSYGGTWSRFLETIFHKDYEMIRYMKSLFGYSITGLIKEHILPIFYGNGSNGKTTLINALRNTLGDSYVSTAAPDLILEKSFSSHPVELADLVGRRLVFSSETDIGNKLNESRVKLLTGGDSIKARRMRENFWEFKPTHKLFLVTNNLPVIEGTDNGIWRRVQIIPFDREITRGEVDKNIDEKLQREKTAILYWVVTGAYEYLKTMELNRPKRLIDVSEKYQEAQNPVAIFINERCAIDHTSKIRSSELFQIFSEWYLLNFKKELTITSFGTLMASNEQRYGLRKQRTSSGQFYVGMRILSDQERLDYQIDNELGDQDFEDEQEDQGSV